jgi:hypothetical protein
MFFVPHMAHRPWQCDHKPSQVSSINTDAIQAWQTRYGLKHTLAISYFTKSPIMQLIPLPSIAAVVALAATTVLTSPAAAPRDANPQLRLIKTSESDPGIWVTEAEKAQYRSRANRQGFIDITDINVGLCPSRLSPPPKQSLILRKLGCRGP